MKRWNSTLKPGKPLNRTAMRRKTRLRYRAKKHRPANDRAAKARADYLAENLLCYMCRHAEYFYPTITPHLAVEVHHIAGRNAKRPDKFEVQENWMPICRACHSTVTDSPVQTAQIVFDAKRFCDPEHASLETLKALNARRFREVTLTSARA